LWRLRAGIMSSVPTDTGTLTVSAVARRLGIAAPTLRSWERRYGLSPSARSTGGHRRYSADDLARLRAMVQLVNSGIPTAEAASTVRDRIDPARSPNVTSATSVAEGTRARGHVVRRTRPGRPRSVDSADLFQLANAMDGERLTHEVARSLDRSGAVEAWTSRLVPLLVGVGDQWERTGESVEVEHQPPTGTASQAVHPETHPDHPRRRQV
jgi:MerR family transcriptional regulator, light-induced transcriptional regulator